MNIRLHQSLSFMLLGNRTNQEDCRWPDADVNPSSQHFFIVCDGVGGQDKGEVASQVVTSTMAQALSRFDWNTSFGNAAFGEMLDEAYNALDHMSSDENQGMATTFTLAVFHAGGVSLAHIGDSRIYHIRPGVGILYRSDDHSLLNSLVHRGILTPEQASVDPRRNIITRFMAPTASDQTRCMANLLNSKDVEAGDYFFLCSDGVLQGVDDDMLLNVLEQAEDNQTKMQLLKQACADSSDNSTAILVQVASIDNAQDIPGQTATAGGDTLMFHDNEEGVVVIASNNRQPARQKKLSFISMVKQKLHL